MEIEKNDYKILNYLEDNPNSSLKQLKEPLKDVKSLKLRIESLHELRLIDAKYRETLMFNQKITIKDSFVVSKLGAIKLQDYRTKRNSNIIKTICYSLILPIAVAVITSLITTSLTN
ncbi:winged helix-turn-helix domain-containing protein [Lactococcus garvieae]|nr:winged helix-turn-helix domain-containing protein [Lactococcus garvieae]